MLAQTFDELSVIVIQYLTIPEILDAYLDTPNGHCL
jgi:hypothetical protein